tara:strand:+ start:316 stop:867 length:552 start_codon:yes stop_codon:yes gene_type:complete
MDTKKITQIRAKELIIEGNSRAAVVVPLILEGKKEEILFTKRTDWLEEHPGQVSFPGGRYEEKDRILKRTAIREAGEEIGIQVHEIEFIGRLDECRTMTKYTITPFIAQIPDRKYIGNVEEVAEVIRYPIEKLIEADNFEWKEHTSGKETILLPHFYIGDNVIWGATARILVQLLEITTEWKC